MGILISFLMFMWVSIQFTYATLDLCQCADTYYLCFMSGLQIQHHSFFSVFIFYFPILWDNIKWHHTADYFHQKWDLEMKLTVTRYMWNTKLLTIMWTSHCSVPVLKYVLNFTTYSFPTLNKQKKSCNINYLFQCFFRIFPFDFSACYAFQSSEINSTQAVQFLKQYLLSSCDNICKCTYYDLNISHTNQWIALQYEF